MSRGDRGTVLPLVLLSFLLAGLLVTAGAAASAAFLAQRDLAGACDGAALAAAAAAVDGPAVEGPAVEGPAVEGPAVEGGAALPLDPRRVVATVERYRLRAGRPGLVLTASTDGRTVTVECHRTARIPFGAVLGRPDGLPRTAVARARSVLLPD